MIDTDFTLRDEELLASNVARHDSDDPVCHPQTCGPCPDCAEYIGDRSAKRTEFETASRMIFSRLGPAPSPDALRKHEEHFGRDGMELYGMGETKQRRKKAARDLRAEVKAFRDRGLTPAQISEAVRIAPRRVNQLLLQLAKSTSSK